MKKRKAAGWLLAVLFCAFCQPVPVGKFDQRAHPGAPCFWETAFCRRLLRSRRMGRKRPSGADLRGNDRYDGSGGGRRRDISGGCTADTDINEGGRYHAAGRRKVCKAT